MLASRGAGTLDSFSLTYNSLNTNMTSVGRGWTHSFNITLANNGNNTFTVTEWRKGTPH